MRYIDRLLHSKKWRDWWITRLNHKPKRLFDLETQEPMIIEKRIHVEIPRLEDFIDFFCNFGVEYVVKNIDDKIIVKLTKDNERIVKVAVSSKEATEAALLDYLKESSIVHRWD